MLVDVFPFFLIVAWSECKGTSNKIIFNKNFLKKGR